VPLLIWAQPDHSYPRKTGVSNIEHPSRSLLTGNGFSAIRTGKTLAEATGLKNIMNKKNTLKDKSILLVDDEPDVLETLEDELDMCTVHKAKDYDTALQFLMNNTYDVVVLDIMGVNGFELLKHAVSKGFPAVMLTAHAVTPEALKKSIKLGAISFLPKEEMYELKEFLEEMVINRDKSLWVSAFDLFSTHFNKLFGPDWKEQDRFFDEFEESLIKSEKEGFL
jgi:CheY-like chemotaxis protein